MTSNQSIGEALDFVGKQAWSPSRLAWNDVKSEVLQKSEPLGIRGVRWAFPSTRNSKVSKDRAVESFCEQMKAAFPNDVVKYPSVRWHDSSLSVDCAESNISPEELVEKARRFHLTGGVYPGTKQMGLPTIMGRTNLPPHIAVVTVNGVRRGALVDFKQHVYGAVLRQLCGPNEELLVKLIDMWQVHNGPEKIGQAGMPTNEIALLVELYEWVPAAQAGADAVAVDDVVAPFKSSEPWMPKREGHLLRRVRSKPSLPDLWLGCIRVSGNVTGGKYLIEYPGRFDYCTHDICISWWPSPRAMQRRHTTKGCPVPASVCKFCGVVGGGAAHRNGTEWCPVLEEKRVEERKNAEADARWMYDSDDDW